MSVSFPYLYIKHYGAKYISLTDIGIRILLISAITPVMAYYFHLSGEIPPPVLKTFTTACFVLLFGITVPHTMILASKKTKPIKIFLECIKTNTFCNLSKQELWERTINLPAKISINLFACYYEVLIPSLIYLYITRGLTPLQAVKLAAATFAAVSLMAQPAQFFLWEVAIRPILSLILTTKLLAEEKLDVEQSTSFKLDTPYKIKIGILSIIMVSLMFSGTLSYNKLLAGINAAKQNISPHLIYSNFILQMSIIALTSAALAIVFSRLLSKNISIPLAALSYSMKKVSEGNLSYQTKVFSNDELGIVIQEFNRMTARISENYQGIKEQNIKLQETDKLKDRFLANTSHELRTPLNGLLGLTDALLSSADGPPDREQITHLAMIKDCGQNLKKLVNDLQDLTKIISGQTVFRMSEFSVTSLLDSMFPLLRGLVGEKDITLKTDVKNDLYVYGDINKIWQVFNNLVGNAVNFTEKGAIIIRVEKITLTHPPRSWTDNKAVQVCVEDSGVGIGPDDQKKIFDEFWRSGEINGQYDSAGLGLYICKKFIEGHSGKIWVNSEIGRGSKFYFILPAAPVKTTGIKPQQKNFFYNPDDRELFCQGQAKEEDIIIDSLHKNIGKGNQEKILIIDDNAINREVVKTYLKLYNYQAITAANGETGFRLAQESLFDLIVLDIMMPKMSGYDFCKIIRKDKNYTHTPIIFLTAKDSLDSILYGFNLGANDYLSKPFNKEELIIKINALIHSRKIGLKLENTIKEHTLIQKELQKAKDRAESANRAKSIFLANISHEIRTPMNTIVGMTDIILNTKTAGEQGKYLHMLKTSANDLLYLINDLLDFSKIRAGKLTIEHINFNLRDCVDHVIDTFSLQAGEKGLGLTVNISPKLPDALIGDPGRLRQIIGNLVSNAVKFTSHGEITLSIDAKAQTEKEIRLHFIVTDTGIGISSKKQKSIFDCFSQIDNSLTRKYAGKGLGLNISCQLVRMMNGKLWVESEEGKGSKFHFIVEFQLQKSPREKQIPTPFDKLQDLAVLVVDDNPTNRCILQELLSNWNMKPTVVDSAKAALTAIEHARQNKKRFPLVITDALMPETDGFALAKQIKSQPESNSANILMLTSIPQYEDAARCQEIGIVGYLIKPVKVSSLLDTIIAVLEQGPLNKPTPPPRFLLTPRQKLKILLVEDIFINQQMATILLNNWGHSVVVANNGKEAVSALEKEPFDLVLMDIQMPKMDGFEATAIIRRKEQETHRHIPIIAVTAHAMEGDRKRCIDAGMDDYVAKPIAAQKLFAAIEFNMLTRSKTKPPPLHNNVRASGFCDKEAILARVGGKRHLLKKIINIFLANYPKTLADIHQAVTNGDSNALHYAAHTLKGAICNCSAQAACEAVSKLELMGRENNLEHAQEAYKKLETELDRLQSELTNYLQEG